MYTVGIITISDKGAAGQREDKSGPKIKELLPKDKYDVVSYKSYRMRGNRLQMSLSGCVMM